MLVKRSISVENRPRSGRFDPRSVEVGQVEKNRPTPNTTWLHLTFYATFGETMKISKEKCFPKYTHFAKIEMSLFQMGLALKGTLQES